MGPSSIRLSKLQAPVVPRVAHNCMKIKKIVIKEYTHLAIYIPKRKDIKEQKFFTVCIDTYG